MDAGKRIISSFIEIWQKGSSSLMMCQTHIGLKGVSSKVKRKSILSSVIRYLRCTCHGIIGSFIRKSIIYWFKYRAICEKKGTNMIGNLCQGICEYNRHGDYCNKILARIYESRVHIYLQQL